MYLMSDAWRVEKSLRPNDEEDLFEKYAFQIKVIDYKEMPRAEDIDQINSVAP